MKESRPLFCSKPLAVKQHRRIMNLLLKLIDFPPLEVSFIIIIIFLLFYSSLFIVNQYSIIQKYFFNTHQR